MHTFKDNKDRLWNVHLDIAAAKRIVGVTGEDILTLIDEDQEPKQSLLYRLQHQPILLCDMIFAICQPQADAQGITQDDFGGAMRGDAIDHATHAMLEEVADFTPNPRDRARAKAVLTANDTANRKLRDRLAEIVDKETSEQAISDLVDDQMLHLFGEPSTDSPVSSESTPDP